MNRTRLFEEALKRSIFGLDPATFKTAVTNTHKHLMAYLRLSLPWLIGSDEEMAAKAIEEMKTQYAERFHAWDDERSNRLIDAVAAVVLKQGRKQRRAAARNAKKGKT